MSAPTAARIVLDIKEWQLAEIPEILDTLRRVGLDARVEVVEPFNQLASVEHGAFAFTAVTA